MKANILIPVLLGIGAVYLLMRKKKKEDGTMTNAMEEMAIAQETNKVKRGFTNAFKMQYDIVLPPVQASKAVKKAAYAMQDDRTAIEMERMASKPAYYL